ncbi:MAG: hypothetical protein NT013_09515 [Planctomycetia bacterium]|nr:hypothetical protein [Planctomycetia bacterium]
MARHESDREDLMQEATGLIRRVEWQVQFQAEVIVAGFKRTGAWSIYFGADPVYQFDIDGRLRRAFAHGDLWRTQGTTLARLKRERTETESGFQRHDLTNSELIEFLREVRQRLEALLKSLDCGVARLLRQVPDEADVTAELATALRAVLSQEIALAPAILGKK